jgi:hypothetical protein
MGFDGNRKQRRGRMGEAVSDNDDGGSVAREAVMGEARSWGPHGWGSRRCGGGSRQPRQPLCKGRRRSGGVEDDE